ncbi:hypothetical protein [Streptomyces sp. DH12]|uniref:deoxynucleotide monophosphate kinase family protein n=1 Tax=Streptomyces sp. DH12 TaxID=2857010 RepID=UPI001E4ACA44|nr:hypothetical protein [Streptomyces sp. DH12]
MGNIGIIGRARTGKDTAGTWLVENRGYRRIAFADPLKEAALKLDPIINYIDMGQVPGKPRTWLPDRLSELVACDGWERAKDEYPEVRRVLQELGAAIRAIDPEFWIRTALTRVQEANESGVPAVITDVRYPNEVASLKRAGFHLIHISRPGAALLTHESEGAVSMSDADHLITNDGAITDLRHRIERVWEDVERAESRRHFARL